MVAIQTGYLGCPTLTWMIAKRVTNPYEEADAFISFTGRKGSSKSTSSIAFCEFLAEDIAKMRGKGEEPTKFFNVDHIKSITEMGAAELLSSGALKHKNSIWLLDDSGTQWSARAFQSQINKSLNAILQICRVYQNVIVCNFIMQSHIDVQARGMTDYRAEMQYKDTSTGQAFFKFFYLEQGERGEYKKFLTWHGKRIKLWVIGKPSPELYAAYSHMRQENTDEFIDATQAKLQEKFNPTKRVDGRIKNYSEMPIVMENKDVVMEMHRAGRRVEAIVRETGLPRYWVQKCVAVGEGKIT